MLLVAIMTLSALETGTSVYADNGEHLITADVSIESTIKAALESAAELRKNTILSRKNQALIDKYINEISEIESAIKEGKLKYSNKLATLTSETDLLLGEYRYGMDVKYVRQIEAILKTMKEFVGDRIKSASIVKLSSINITDIEGHWAARDIDFLVANGDITGYKQDDDTYLFKPDDKISRAEFLKIAMCSANSSNNKINPTSTYWASGFIDEAKKLELVYKGEITDWDTPITRNEMAMLMYRINWIYQNALNSMIVNNYKWIKDYDKIDKYYAAYAVDMVAKGIISGKGGGVFDGTSTGTRAEAATMIVRLVNTTKRINRTDTHGYKPSTQTRLASAMYKPRRTETIVLRWDDPSRPTAKEGDTFIKPDGTNVVLKKGPNGIVGEGQRVALDLGRVINRDGGYARVVPNYQTYVLDFGGALGDIYRVCPYTREAHWIYEWMEIYNSTSEPEYRGKKDMELSKDGYYIWRDYYDSYRKQQGYWSESVYASHGGNTEYSDDRLDYNPNWEYDDTWKNPNWEYIGNF